MADLSRKRERERLRVRREPHWQRLEKGKYLGLRRSNVADTWHVRLRDRSGKQHQQSLGPLASYDEAKKAAEEWLKKAGAAPIRHVIKGTVKDALEAYLDYLKDHGREPTSKLAATKFRATVWNHAIAGIRLSDLTSEDFRDWRDGLRAGRQPQSLNRIVRDVQAGLNRAIKLGFIGDPRAWKIDPLVEDNEDTGSTTATVLSPGQRKALISAASTEGGRFFRGLELTAARPGELAKAKVKHVSTHGEDTYLELCHWKGRPARPHWRSVLLTKEGARFFRALTKGRSTDEALFVNSVGKPWIGKTWSDEFNAARCKVNERAVRTADRIPEDRITYSFRHSRISELLQEHKIDALTVAKQAGTSVRMLEMTYYSFLPQHYREQIKHVDKDQG